MAEKREIEHIAGDKPDDGKEYLHTSIGFDRSAEKKYEIYFLVPITDIEEELKALSDECKERYDCDLAEMIRSGVRQLTTRPDYKAVGFNEDGSLKVDKDGKETGHEAMQDLANGYKVGARAVGEGVKTKAKKLDTLTEKYGDGDTAALEAKLAKYEELKAQGLID